jgi:type VI secretion system secreted protein Hcp
MAFDAFLKIDGIDGESTDKVHPGEIEIQSFSWGVTNTGSAIGGGGGAGKASFSDLNFASSLSKASPNLMLASATGKHIASATLTCRKSGGNGIEFLKIKLSDILVSSYQSGGSTGADLPEDSFGLNFTKIDFLYTVAKTGETVETAFDLRENKA